MKNVIWSSIERIARSGPNDYEIRFGKKPFIENHGLYGSYMPLFVTMALTGARIGEILGLTWNDLDFGNETISITKTLQYKNLHDGNGTHFFITEPKTEASSADIPMMKEL